MPAIDPRGFAPPRPITTTVAFWCWLAGAVLVVIGLPSLLYTGIDGLADEMLRDSLGANEPMTADEAQLTARITPVLVALGLAVAAVPFVVAAAKLRSGRNWARILLTVLAAPSALFGLFVLLAFTTDGLPYVPWVLGVAWSYLFIGVCALGFVAMYLPASNAYVRSVTG